MHLLELETSRWRLISALALFELAALAFLIYLVSMRRRRWPNGASLGSLNLATRRDPTWVSREIERLCAGKELNEPLIKQMSAEERALFEVSVIDALNGVSREGQHRLRSALVRYGYDEQCSRRVMSQDFTDRVRATALLSVLRPQWRDVRSDPEGRKGGEGALAARATGADSGPLEPE